MKIIYELDLINMKMRLELMVSERLYQTYSLHTLNMRLCSLLDNIYKRIYADNE